MPPWIHRFALALSTFVMLPLAFAGPARATESVGALGPIVVVARNTDSADLYLQYNGRMIVGDAIGGYLEYRWGGTSCGSRTLTEAQTSDLLAAMNNPRVLIQPVWQDGQGSTLCLVGYSFVLRSETGALP
jgi:hypothetical protein